MKLLLALLLLIPVSCKAQQSASEKLTEYRVEIYQLVDAIRALDADLADELLNALILLEIIGTKVDMADASD